MARRVRYYSAKRRRAMYEGQKVNALCLFAIYGWRCALCGEPIDPSKRFPEPDCATLDHIVPLALGGTHSWNNCQPAHKDCNEAKGCAA